MRRRAHREHADSGAALLLAVGFVVMVSGISGGLAALATSSLNNRSTLESVRNREYAADGAIENAIALVRLNNCSTPNGSIVDSTMAAGSIRVDWVNECGVVQSADGSAVAQRNVIFSACLNTTTQCSDTNVPPSPIIIRAEVNFQQAASGAVTRTYVQSWSVKR